MTKKKTHTKKKTKSAMYSCSGPCSVSDCNLLHVSILFQNAGSRLCWIFFPLQQKQRMKQRRNLTGGPCEALLFSPATVESGPPGERKGCRGCSRCRTHAPPPPSPPGPLARRMTPAPPAWQTCMAACEDKTRQGLDVKGEQMWKKIHRPYQREWNDNWHPVVFHLIYGPVCYKSKVLSSV